MGTLPGACFPCFSGLSVFLSFCRLPSGFSSQTLGCKFIVGISQGAQQLSLLPYKNLIRILLEPYIKANKSFVQTFSISAKVILDQKSPFLKSILINKGTREGVTKGMTVFSKDYLMGTVIIGLIFYFFIAVLIKAFKRTDINLNY